MYLNRHLYPYIYIITIKKLQINYEITINNYTRIFQNIPVITFADLTFFSRNAILKTGTNRKF